MAISVGMRLGQYEILGPLGAGGMGQVYRARDIDLRREVAIKVLPEGLASNSELLGRFENEARLASSLNHPNIISIYAIGQAGTTRYTVMELVNGQTLAEMIADGPIPMDRLLRVVIQAAEGLARAHEAGIIHRDVKPQNIMVTRDGLTKILDFGLSKNIIPAVTHGNVSTVRFERDGTAPGIILGTVDYMSPEQAGGGDIDFRSDQFSFGCLLYEMITGNRPFHRGKPVQTLAAIMESEAAPVSSMNRAAPPRLEALVKRCMAKTPGDRYGSTSEIADELKQIQEDLERSASIEKPAGSRKPAVMMFAVILIVIAAATLLLPGIRRSFDGFFQSTPASRDQLVAILPFANVGADPTAQPFCDGLVEVLTSKLTQIQPYHKGLHIVPSSEIRREGIASARDALKSFGADVVVTGSVQRSAEKVRLTINVIDSKTMRQLDAASLDAVVRDVSVLQDGIVIRVAELLGLRLNAAAKEAVLSGGTTEPNAYDYYVQGRGYLQRFEQLDSVSNAIELFQRAIERDPQYTLAYAGLGEAYWRKYAITKDTALVEEARRVTEKAMERSQNIGGAHFTLALIDAGAGQYEDAVKELQRVLEIDPVHADAYRELAATYGKMGKLDEAEATYKKAIEIQPNSWAGYSSLGVFYYQRARYKEAETQFLKAIELTPDNARAYRNLGAAYYSEHRYEEAAAMFEKSASLQPSDNIALSNLGAIYFFLGQYPRSARMLERALTINDKNHVTWLNLASALYWAPNERPKAKAAYEQAAKRAEAQVQLNPRQPNVLVDLAEAYFGMGEETRSRERLRQALKTASNDASVLYRAGSVYEQLGDRARAIELIGEAIRKGYSRDLMERSPTLAELRKDSRFRSIESQTADKGGK